MNKFVLENQTGAELTDKGFVGMSDDFSVFQNLMTVCRGYDPMVQHYVFLFKMGDFLFMDCDRYDLKNRLNPNIFLIFWKTMNALIMFNFAPYYIENTYSTKYQGTLRYFQFLLLNFKNVFEETHRLFEKNRSPSKPNLPDGGPNPEIIFLNAKKEAKNFMKSVIALMEKKHKEVAESAQNVDSFLEFDILLKDKIKVANYVLGSIAMNSLQYSSFTEAGALHIFMTSWLGLNTDQNEEKFKKLMEKRKRKEQWNPEYEKLEKYFNEIYLPINADALSQDQMIEMVANNINDFHRIYLKYEYGFPSQRCTQDYAYGVAHRFNIQLKSFINEIGPKAEVMNEYLQQLVYGDHGYEGNIMYTKESFMRFSSANSRTGIAATSPPGSQILEEQIAHAFAILMLENCSGLIPNEFFLAASRIKHEDARISERFEEESLRMANKFRDQIIYSNKKDRKLGSLLEKTAYNLLITKTTLPPEIMAQYYDGNPTFGYESDSPVNMFDGCCAIY